jgi:uncharacterized protein (DUF1330 family)
MPAFVIVDIDISDPAGYEEYRKLATPTVSAMGGKYVARGGKTEVLEGTWKPNRLVILQFDSIEKAKAWLNSEEYGTHEHDCDGRIVGKRDEQANSDLRDRRDRGHLRAPSL